MQIVSGLSAVKKVRRLTRPNKTGQGTDPKRSRSELIEDMRRLATAYEEYPILHEELLVHTERLERGTSFLVKNEHVDDPDYDIWSDYMKPCMEV